MSFDMIMQSQELIAIASVVAEEDYRLAQSVLNEYQNNLRSIDYNHDVVVSIEREW